MAIKTKPTMDYLTDISKILNEEIEKPITLNEFTAEMFRAEYQKKHGQITMDAACARLSRMVLSGKMSKRKIIRNGSGTNVYKLIK